jgi:hypothetical protein
MPDKIMNCGGTEGNLAPVALHTGWFNLPNPMILSSPGLDDKIMPNIIWRDWCFPNLEHYNFILLDFVV